jgi:hypothetical protein
MRLVILVVLILLVCSLVGWITFSKQPGQSSINIETDQIRADADRAVASGAQVLKNAGQEIDNRVSDKKEPAPTVENESAPVNR